MMTREEFIGKFKVGDVICFLSKGTPFPTNGVKILFIGDCVFFGRTPGLAEAVWSFDQSWILVTPEKKVVELQLWVSMFSGTSDKKSWGIAIGDKPFGDWLPARINANGVVEVEVEK